MASPGHLTPDRKVNAHPGAATARGSQRQPAKRADTGSGGGNRRGSIQALQAKAGNRAVVQLLATQLHQGNAVVVQRGEAHVHEDIERLAAAGSPKEFVREMYAGNWMRDYSQLNLPLPHDIASRLPRDLGRSKGEPVGEPIGAAGAEDIITAVIRALAHLEFGPDLTNELITPENIGRYTPEQHVDNPMGTGPESHLVRDSSTGLLRTADPTLTTVRDASGPIATESHSDPDRDEQLAGKAFAGLQAGNPKLFEISDAGLTNHIYNGAEWAKQQLGFATTEGSTPRGRMYLGSALHAVEDYYAHSNFIEVALNSEIDRAMKASESGARSSLSADFLGEARTSRAASGLYVDSVYGTGEDVARSASGRVAVTTGTAGSLDLSVSLGQLLLPKLPDLAEQISTKIDTALGLIVETEGATKWERIKKHLESEQGGAAAMEIFAALDRHITVPIWDADLKQLDIPGTDRFIPVGIDKWQRRGGLGEAMQSYIKTYERWNDYMEQASAAFDFILDLSVVFHRFVREKIDELKQHLKQMIMEFLVSLAERITGIKLRNAHESLEQTLKRAGSMSVEHIRQQTSIESQLPGVVEDGEFDPEIGAAHYGLVDGKPQYPLPPSHSEISKDHPPHQDADEVDATDDHDIEQGSIFYGLHHALAVEADSHMIAKMQEVWDEQVQANSVDSLRSSPRLDVDEITAEATRRQEQEQQRAAAEGRMSDAGTMAGQSSELLAMVDLFIAHPDDSSWWQPILTSYVDDHEPEVIRHIQARNRTRSIRS